MSQNDDHIGQKDQDPSRTLDAGRSLHERSDDPWAASEGSDELSPGGERSFEDHSYESGAPNEGDEPCVTSTGEAFSQLAWVS